MTKAGIVIYPDVEEEKAFRREFRSIRRKLLPSWSLRDVFKHYDMSARQATDVVTFLLAHGYLLSILLDAVPHIKQVFGQSPVYLEVERDPDEGFEELFAVVMIDAEPQKALALLAQFDREWFAQAAKRTRSRLNFTVDTLNDESV